MEGGAVGRHADSHYVWLHPGEDRLCGGPGHMDRSRGVGSGRMGPCSELGYLPTIRRRCLPEHSDSGPPIRRKASAEDLRDTAVLGGAIGLGLGLFYFVLGFLHPLFWKHSLTAQQITFGLLFAGIASTIRLASSLRPLRAAPVTSARLAAFCVATPMVAALSAVAGGLLAQALTGRMHSVGLANLASWLSCVFFLPLTGCAMLRFSGTTGGYFLSIFLCVFPGMFLAQEEVPAAAYIQVLAMAPLSLLAWWWNHRLITRSSAIYQAMRFLPKPA